MGDEWEEIKQLMDSAEQLWEAEDWPAAREAYRGAEQKLAVARGNYGHTEQVVAERGDQAYYKAKQMRLCDTMESCRKWKNKYSGMTSAELRHELEHKEWLSPAGTNKEMIWRLIFHKMMTDKGSGGGMVSKMRKRKLNERTKRTKKRSNQKRTKRGRKSRGSKVSRRGRRTMNRSERRSKRSRSSKRTNRLKRKSKGARRKRVSRSKITRSRGGGQKENLQNARRKLPDRRPDAEEHPKYIALELYGGDTWPVETDYSAWTLGGKTNGQVVYMLNNKSDSENVYLTYNQSETRWEIMDAAGNMMVYTTETPPDGNVERINDLMYIQTWYNARREENTVSYTQRGSHDFERISNLREIRF